MPTSRIPRSTLRQLCYREVARSCEPAIRRTSDNILVSIRELRKRPVRASKEDLERARGAVLRRRHIPCPDSRAAPASNPVGQEAEMPDDWALDPPVVCRWWCGSQAGRAWREQTRLAPEMGRRPCGTGGPGCGAGRAGPAGRRRNSRGTAGAPGPTRWGSDSRGDHLRHFLRGPAFVLGVAGACLVVTNGYRAGASRAFARCGSPSLTSIRANSTRSRLTDLLGRGAGCR